MTVNDLTIREIKARAVVAPLKRPVRTAVGTIPSAPLVLIDVLTEQGSAGRSYIFRLHRRPRSSLWCAWSGKSPKSSRANRLLPSFECENSIGAFAWSDGKD